MPTNENPSLYSSHVSVAVFGHQVLHLVVNALTAQALFEFNQYPSLHAVHTYGVSIRSSTAAQFSTVISTILWQILYLFKNHNG